MAGWEQMSVFQVRKLTYFINCPNSLDNEFSNEIDVYYDVKDSRKKNETSKYTINKK